MALESGQPFSQGCSWRARRESYYCRWRQQAVLSPIHLAWATCRSAGIMRVSCVCPWAYVFIDLPYGGGVVGHQLESHFRGFLRERQGCASRVGFRCGKRSSGNEYAAME